MAAITLRDATAEDAPALARLYLAARAVALPGLDEAYTEAEVARWLASNLMRHHSLRVATADRAPIGYIGHGLDHHHGPMVFHLYLDPAWHRRGIGSRLLGEALTAHGGRLALFCIARNAGARAFYLRHGFHPAACSDGAGAEEREPDILYRIGIAPPAHLHRTGEFP